MAPGLGDLGEDDLLKLAEAVTIDEFEDGQHIIDEGELGTMCYIVESGNVKVYKKIEGDEGEGSSFVKSLSAGDYFGESALQSGDVRRAASVIASGRVTLLTVERSHLVHILGDLIYNFINGIRAQHGRDPINEKKQKARANSITIASTSKAADIRTSPHYRNLTSKDLHYIKVIGKGAFGNVKLVTDIATNDTYALKCLSKVSIIGCEVQHHVVDEKKIMLMLDHPFIVRLHNTFQDQYQLYLLLELALGGELLQILDRQPLGYFDENTVRFYGASLVEVFKHIHDKRIAYRDLKPENLLLDKSGYLVSYF